MENLKQQQIKPTLRALMTRERWIEVARIVLVGLIALLYWQQMVPLGVLFAAVVVGLYPLLKWVVLDLIHEHKIGTEIFVSVATVIAIIAHEYVAAAVLMDIILIAGFIAELNTERARVEIKSLIGSVPQVALVRSSGQERTVPITELKVGDVVLVRSAQTAGMSIDYAVTNASRLLGEAAHELAGQLGNSG
jgi:cation transport ATPase